MHVNIISFINSEANASELLENIEEMLQVIV